MNAITSFYDDIEPLLKKCGREKGDVKLVVASKYFSVDQIQKLYEMGQRDFGENRVQDALGKIDRLPKDIIWHFIGRLQKNKVNKVVDKFDLIHSVDSLELAQKLSEKSTQSQKILVQVNVSQEESKSGFTKEEFLKVYPQIESLKNIELCGLMTMAPLSDDKDLVHRSFEGISLIKKELRKVNWLLSMGMSQDYPIAIEEGANLVRIGSHFLKGL